jgi:hypothetical protein
MPWRSSSQPGMSQTLGNRWATPTVRRSRAKRLDCRILGRRNAKTPPRRRRFRWCDGWGSNPRLDVRENMTVQLKLPQASKYSSFPESSRDHSPNLKKKVAWAPVGNGMTRLWPRGRRRYATLLVGAVVRVPCPSRERPWGRPPCFVTRPCAPTRTRTCARHAPSRPDSRPSSP